MSLWSAFILLFLVPFSLIAITGEEEAVRRTFAFLKIGSPRSAVIEARTALEKYPESETLREALVSSLSANGEEKEALRLFAGLCDSKDWMQKRRQLNDIAWSILSKGNQSDQLLVRAASLVGASLTHDVKAVPFLLMHLRSSNAALKVLALHFAPFFCDKILCEEITRLLGREQVLAVRCEAIRAIGKMGIAGQNASLKEIIVSPKALGEEKEAAMDSLLMLSEDVQEKEILSLLKSNRAGFRQLGCEIVARFGQKERKEEIVALLKDPSLQVRLSALHALGMIGDAPAVCSLFDDPSPEVAITAAWSALRMGEKKSEEVIEKWCEASNPDLRRYAAASLATAGLNGTGLSLKILKKSTDPYVRVNLALGLIGYRVETALACEEIARFFMTEKGLLMRVVRFNSHISAIEPGAVRHVETIPRYPQLVDDMVRLELLRVLAMMRYPDADEVVKEFLKHEIWGVSFTAGELLLREGEGEVVDLIQDFLHSSEESLKLQAALLLSVMVGDEAAFKVLKEAYPTATRDRKIAILETLVQNGSKELLPFLIECLNDPFQILRILSASALIQCLQS